MELVRATNQLQQQSNIDLKELIDLFILNSDVKEKSKQTYKQNLKTFFRWIDERGYSSNLITRAIILEWKEDLIAIGRSSLTINNYLTSVRVFFEFLEVNGIYQNVAKSIKTLKRTQKFRKQPLLPEQAKEFISHCEALSPRDFALTNLIIRTGLRTIEVIRANVGDIAFKGGKRVLLVQGKGSTEKDNFVILTDKSYGPLKAYLDSRLDAKEDEPLFTSVSNNSSGNRLTTRSISRIIKDNLVKIGLDDKCFTAHSLRHTCATSILRAGGSIEMAQMALRHSSPTTTQIYVSTLDEERRLNNSGEALIDSLY